MTNDYEVLATVTVLRSRRTGEYACNVSFQVHGEARQGFPTIDGTMSVAADLIRDELHTRPTEPELVPVEVP
jgi:hypothetical protein